MPTCVEGHATEADRLLRCVRVSDHGAGSPQVSRQRRREGVPGVRRPDQRSLL